MTWYAETAELRRRQVITDVVVALWVLLWLRVGMAVHDGVQRLAAPGVELQEAGSGLAGGLGAAAERAGSLPGIGRQLRAPLDSAAGAGDALAGAGAAQQAAVGTLALLLALLLGGLPVLWALSRWLPDRLRWSRESTAARALCSDVELLALRAATASSLAELAALGPDPVSRWRAGDADAGRALAALELRRLGLREGRAGSLGR
jgi:hypothetical protein